MRSQFAGNQSALNPHGPHAGAIADMSWLYVDGFLLVWLAVMIILAVGIVSARRGRFLTDLGSRQLVVWAGVVVPLIVLIAFLVHSVVTGEKVNANGARFRDALRVRIIGKQWWWDVTYMQDGRPMARVANEIHVPVGRPIVFELETEDVIHSFWVPALAGKRDLIPGRKNQIWLEADKPGVFRGQCAEYCGEQHAHMGLEVIAEPAHEFARWFDWQSKPATAPQGEAAFRGQQAFLSAPCTLCHAVRGTNAGAQFGPDLTHVASRRWLAAATLPHSRGSIAGWVTQAQAVKPGAKMPNINLPAQDLQDILEYLEGLQ
jgi:cytochrome c oxidase subunit 2